MSTLALPCIPGQGYLLQEAVWYPARTIHDTTQNAWCHTPLDTVHMTNIGLACIRDRGMERREYLDEVQVGESKMKKANPCEHKYK